MNNLNPKIKAAVKWLQENGFHTTDSGDGETHDFECDQKVPYVHMVTTKDKLVSESERLVSLLSEKGVELLPCDPGGTVPTVEGSYLPLMGIATITLWNVTL